MEKPGMLSTLDVYLQKTQMLKVSPIVCGIIGDIKNIKR